MNARPARTPSARSPPTPWRSASPAASAVRHGRGTVRRVTPVHVILAAIAAGGTVTLLVAAALAASGRPILRTLVDALLVIVLTAIVAGAATGGVLLAVGPGPADVLHALYAGVAVVALPIARVVGARRDPPAGRTTSRGIGRWLVAGSLVTLGILLRLWMTG